MKGKAGFSNNKVFSSVKEFLHPKAVTWITHKNALHKTLVVLGVVAVSAVIMVSADAVVGVLLGLAM